MKNNKGITLIALVITIIVLLILAGVSIAMLTGENGILTQATNSKAETMKAEAVERINLTLNAVKTEIYKQQVSKSTWSPIDTDNSLKTEISDVIEADGFETTQATATEGKYTYKLDGSVLTLYYINSAAGVKTAVTGNITLTSASNYLIDKAK